MADQTIIKDPKENDADVWRDPRYVWKGVGPEPAKWWADDGTLVYRSYADYCDD